MHTYQQFRYKYKRVLFYFIFLLFLRKEFLLGLLIRTDFEQSCVYLDE